MGANWGLAFCTICPKNHHHVLVPPPPPIQLVTYFPNLKIHNILFKIVSYLWLNSSGYTYGVKNLCLQRYLMVASWCIFWVIKLLETWPILTSPPPFPNTIRVNMFYAYVLLRQFIILFKRNMVHQIILRKVNWHL